VCEKKSKRDGNGRDHNAPKVEGCIQVVEGILFKPFHNFLYPILNGKGGTLCEETWFFGVPNATTSLLRRIKDL
jgi:hypothetical protein